ncbi:MAG: hypothetical protein RLZZ618_1687 [Pseudomonadota bacterium]
MNPLLEVLASTAAQAPWMAPYCVAAGELAQTPWHGTLADTLNAAWPDGIGLHAGPLRFVPQDVLSEGEAYEAFIHRQAAVPTRDNLHDLFNALVWRRFPRLKRHLNALQASQIAQAGVGRTRGPVRDALTVFDENAAVLQAPDELVHALRVRDWKALFIGHRALWSEAQFTLFGHALLEKLVTPRKPITAHVWLVPMDVDLEDHLIERLTPDFLAAKTQLPLPVLGVPGWWTGNAEPDFYDDVSVFRPLKG